MDAIKMRARNRVNRTKLRKELVRVFTTQPFMGGYPNLISKYLEYVELWHLGEIDDFVRNLYGLEVREIAGNILENTDESEREVRKRVALAYARQLRQ